MRDHKCENCNEAFLPRQHGQRFCSKECGIEYFAKERREAVKQYRQRQEEERAAS
jgi:hypothetical protein